MEDSCYNEELPNVALEGTKDMIENKKEKSRFHCPIRRFDVHTSTKIIPYVVQVYYTFANIQTDIRTMNIF